MDNNPDRNDNRIFYSKSRTGSVCTYETGRGAYGWGYFRKVNADKPFGWCGSFSRSFDVKSFMPDIYFVSSDTRVCDSTYTDEVCSKNIYSDSKLRIQHAGHESGAGWRSSRWDSASWKGCWNEKAGVTSKAGTIVFSLPVTSTAGLRSIEDI